jgi:putative glycosyltransferase (TIGR04372 family)
MDKRFRIIKSEPDLLITLPFSLLLILLILILRFLNLRIRVGFIHNDRLGHFAANTELYLLEKKEKQDKYLDLFYFPRKKSCNFVLESIWKRYLFVFPRVILRPIDLIIRNFDFLKFLRCGNTLNEDRDVQNLLDKYSPNIEFTISEEQLGLIELTKLGLNRDDKFVCLNVRDDAYLGAIYTSSFNYHGYRNSDVNNYIDAIEYLIGQGFYVIRMGSKVNNKVNFNNEKFIDYSFSGKRTEFMDIYLGAKCYFCITTGSGFDSIPYIFRRPILYTNYLPTGYFMTFQKKSMIIPKNHFSIDLKRNLTLSEIIEKGVFLSLKSEDFEFANVKLVENTPLDLKNAVIDMINYLDIFIFNEELNFKFWSNYPNNIKNNEGKNLHGIINSKICPSFLLEYDNWLK